MKASEVVARMQARIDAEGDYEATTDDLPIEFEALHRALLANAPVTAFGVGWDALRIGEVAVRAPLTAYLMGHESPSFTFGYKGYVNLSDDDAEGRYAARLIAGANTDELLGLMPNADKARSLMVNLTDVASSARSDH